MSDGVIRTTAIVMVKRGERAAVRITGNLVDRMRMRAQQNRMRVGANKVQQQSVCRRVQEEPK